MTQKYEVDKILLPKKMLGEIKNPNKAQFGQIFSEYDSNTKILKGVDNYIITIADYPFENIFDTSSEVETKNSPLKMFSKGHKFAKKVKRKNKEKNLNLELGVINYFSNQDIPKGNRYRVITELGSKGRAPLGCLFYEIDLDKNTVDAWDALNKKQVDLETYLELSNY